MKDAAPITLVEVPYEMAPKKIQRYMKKHGLDTIIGHVASAGDGVNIRVSFGKFEKDEDNTPAVLARDGLRLIGINNGILKQIFASVLQPVRKSTRKNLL